MDQKDLILCGLIGIGISAFLLVIGLFRGYDDIRMAMQGERTDATFIRFSRIIMPRGGRSSRKWVHYRFRDKTGLPCAGYATVPLGWSPPADDKLKIVYRPCGMVGDKLSTVSRLDEKGSTVVGAALVLTGLLGGATSVFATVRFMLRAKPDF